MQPLIDFKPAAPVSEAVQSARVPAKTVELSIVVPTYNAEPCLKVLHARLTQTLSKLVDSYELVFVEDCSKDNSWRILQEIGSGDSYVRLLRLSRNFGQQRAITAGLSRARGQRIVVMDCDLQDPPEDIPRLYAEALKGHEIVLARRLEQKSSPFGRTTNKMYFAMLGWFSGCDLSGGYGGFSIISRKVRDAFMQFSEGNRHYLLILFWLGFDWHSIEYERDERYAGKSSYKIFALLAHAFSGVLFQTTALLRLILTAGFFISGLAVFMAIWALVGYIWHGALAGWTSLTALILGLSGFIIMCQGITGLYLGEIFSEVKRRPLFLIAEDYCPNEVPNERRD